MSTVNRPAHFSTAVFRPRVSRLAYLAAALLCFATPLLWAGLRGPDGSLTARFCLPAAAGIGLLVIAAAANSPFRAAAFWFAVAAVGQAATLQLIEAGTGIRYQHYKPLEWFHNVPMLPLACVAVQLVLTAAGFRKRYPRIRRSVDAVPRKWPLLAVVLLLIASGAAPSRDAAAYAADLAFAAFSQLLNLATVLLTVFAIPEERLAALHAKWQAATALRLCGVDATAVAAAVFVTLAAAGLSLFSYERHPHVADEVVYLYHARYLAEGMLTMSAPPVPAAFDLDLMNYEPDRWFCPVPPGWPAMLAIGVFFSVPWLVNPILAGMNILLAFYLVKHLYDQSTARTAALLLAASPWHVFMGMNFMPHTFSMTCALAGAAALVRAHRTGKAGWAGMAGVAAGLVSLTRPLEGLVVLLVFGVAILAGFRRWRPLIAAATVFGMATAVVGVAVFPYNELLTGDPTVFPIMAYTDKYYGPKSNALGFGPQRGLNWPLDPYPGHTPLDGAVNAALNTASINTELLGWSTGSLLFLALPVLTGRLRKPDWIMVLGAAAVFIAHFFYWFSGGPDFGARYWYLMLAPCIVLTVRGIQVLQRSLPCGSPDRTRIGIAAAALCALTLVNYFPWRAMDKYRHYLMMRPDVPRLARAHGFGRSLVLVRGQRYPDYASAAVYNPIDLHAAEPVYAWDKDPAVRTRVLQAYPDRPVWILEGPTLTGEGFRVVAGPLVARELLPPPVLPAGLQARSHHP
jgi:hypothetical protein